MTPFERFFAGVFQQELELVQIPKDAFTTPPAGPVDASWDRRAAWLLWCEREGINPDMEPAGPALTEDGY